jgi:HSP20 family protein
MLTELAPWNWMDSDKRRGRRQPTGGNPALQLRNEMDRALEGFFRFLPQPWNGDFPGSGTSGRSFFPQMNISETENAFEIELEVPGVKKENIEIFIGDGKLTIEGHRSHRRDDKPEDDQERKYHRVESSYGSFRRELALPDNVSDEDIKASFDDGVLTLKVAKLEEAGSKRKKIALE